MGLALRILTEPTIGAGMRGAIMPRRLPASPSPTLP
jgi:hypothetical protein